MIWTPQERKRQGKAKVHESGPEFLEIALTIPHVIVRQSSRARVADADSCIEQEVLCGEFKHVRQREERDVHVVRLEVPLHRCWWRCEAEKEKWKKQLSGQRYGVEVGGRV
jgi:hypothetical protein